MRIGGMLVAAGYISEPSLQEALSFQRQFNGLIGQACLKLGFLSEDDLLSVLSKQLHLSILEKGHIPDSVIVKQALAMLGLSSTFCRRYDALIWFEETPVHGRDDLKEECLFVVSRNPIQQGLQEELEKRYSGSIRYQLGANRTIDAVLDSVVQNDKLNDDEASGLARLRQLAEEAPVIEFVNGLLSDALEQGASDIHIEPEETRFRTRFRMDGVLGSANFHPKQTFDAVSTRIKILSLMDIAERRLPQDGRQGVRVAGQEIDLRVSTLPGAHGESIVIRLLRKKAALPNIQGLGLEGKQLSSFASIVQEPNGIVLVTGPTGSGKSTTLYRVLEQMNNGERKIITIEDPIEYEVNGITQVHARSEIGLTFAAGLRSMLRQDPDVIMVGEIRDADTALIATQAALTGHLVLSTLHTNTAFGSIERLVDLGVEAFLVEASLKGVIGQRLIRRLCTDCVEPDEATALSSRADEVAKELLQEREQSISPKWMKPVGCSQCNMTGYRGRVGVFEVLDMREHRQIVMSQVLTADEKLERLHQAGFRTMKEDGIYRAALGETSLKEIERVFGGV